MKTKRIISLLLSAVMTVSTVPVMASAVSAASANLLEGVTPTTTAAKTEVEAVGLDNEPLAANESNKYLHFYNMDATTSAAVGEGIKVSFKPVSGVTEYYIEYCVRYANDSDNDLSKGTNGYSFVRIAAVSNVTVANIWGVGDVKGMKWTAGSGKYTNSKLTVTSSDVASVRIYKENRGGGLGKYPVVPLDYDDVHIYYLNGSEKVTVAKWNFENDSVTDGKIVYGNASNPAAWIEAHNYLTADQMGPATIEIRSEKDYTRYDDISGAKALTYAPDGGIGKGIYRLTFDARMDKFNSVGGEASFNLDNFVTAIGVTDSNGKTLATLNVSPEWGASAEIEVLSATDSITFTADKAFAIDVADVSLVKLRNFDYTVDADGNIIDGANLFTADELGSSSGDNRYMRVTGRKIGAWDGVGFTFDGTFEKGKTYYISLDARTALTGNKKVSLTATVDVLNYGYSATALNYITVPAAPYPTYFQSGAGMMVDEGWSTYNFKFMPDETVNRLSVSLASNMYYTNRGNAERIEAWNDTRYKEDGGNGDLTQIPLDIDNIVIYEDGKKTSPIFADDFENGTYDDIYVPSAAVYAATTVKLFTLNKGNSVISFDNDTYSTVTSASGAPSMEFSEFAGLDLTKIEPGIYKFSADVRLGYYDGTLDSDKNAVSLDLDVRFADGSSDSESYTVTAGWTTVEYSFKLSHDDAAPEAVSLDFAPLGEGYTENTNVIHYRNVSIEEVSLFKNPIAVGGGTDNDGSLDLYTVNTVIKNEEDADNGYLQVYNRRLGEFDGVGIKLDGVTLTAGETYCVRFDARKSHESGKNIAITVAGSAKGTDGKFFGIPTTYPQPYYDGSGSNGAVIKDGWNTYVYEYTPAADVTNPIFYLMSNHYWNSRDSYKHWNDVRYGTIPASGTLPQDSFTANPFDIDNVEIFKKGDSNVIVSHDFENGLPEGYAPAKGKSQGYGGEATYNVGNAVIAVENDDFYRVNGTSVLEFTDIELETGKYAFETEIRLPAYDAEIDTTYNKARLTVTAEFGDGSTETAEFDVTTAFETVKYDFFTEDAAKLEKLTLRLTALGDGYTAKVGAFDFRNLALTSQIFEIVAEDGENYLNGASVYSVGSIVVTEVLDENGNPDGYLRVYDRPFGGYDGLGIKLADETLTAGETYYITFRARKSYPGNKDVALTVAGNVKTASDSYFAPPVNPPAPYQTGNGAVAKDEWQTYTYKYVPAEDVTDPTFTVTSNHYYQQRTDSSGAPVANRIEYWNSVRYGELDSIGSHAQNNFVVSPFDIDDLAIYKEGEADAPIFSDSFTDGISDAYASSKGNNQGASGLAVYGSGEAKLMHETDVYESVVNEKSAPALVIEDIPELEPGRYVFKAFVRRGGEYDGELPFADQPTSVLTVEGTVTDGDGNVKVRRTDVTVGNYWDFVYLIVEVKDAASTLSGFKLSLDGPGSFDYRGITLLYSPKDEVSIPNMGIIMMLLKKREKGDDFADGGKSDKEISVDRLPNYLEDAMTEEGMASWQANGQTLTAKTDGTLKYLAATDIKDNYSGVVYKSGKTLKAGTYLLKLKVRTAVPEEKMQMRIYLGDIIKTVRIDGEWMQLEYVLDVKADTELRFKLSGGPLAFYMNSFDFADLSLVCLDQLAEGQRVTVGGNLFAAGDFEDADHVYSWNRGINEKQGWTGMTVTPSTEEDGNGYVAIGNRQANYQNIDLDTGVIVDEGRIYTVKFRIRTSDASATSGIRAYAGTGSSPNYKLKVGDEGSPDPASSWYNSFAINGKWKEVTTTYVAEAGGSLKLRFSGDTSVNSVHDIDIDGIEVYLVFEG